MMNSLATSRLTPTHKRGRFAFLALLPAALGANALVEPGSLPGSFPFATSCGAITGLPCIFCGITRGLHHLLHGEFARAIYFNWLVLPLLAGALTLFLVSALELLLARNILARLPRV